MRELFKIIGKVKSEFPNEIIIESGNIINTEHLLNIKNLDINITSNSQYLMIERNNFDIKIGLNFNIIFPFSDPKNYIKTKTTLKFVNVNPKIESDTILAGYSGIGLFDFPNGKPNILNKLNEYMKHRDKNKEYALYFTTQPVMDRILKLL